MRSSLQFHLFPWLRIQLGWRSLTISLRHRRRNYLTFHFGHRQDRTPLARTAPKTAPKVGAAPKRQTKPIAEIDPLRVEAIIALRSLGFHTREAQSRVALATGATAAELVKAALRNTPVT